MNVNDRSEVLSFSNMERWVFLQFPKTTFASFTSHANINFLLRHPAMPSSWTQVVRRCLSFESLSSSSSNEWACRQDMFPMDLIVDDSEDIRATKVLNWVRRGAVVLPYFSASFESLYVRRRKGMYGTEDEVATHEPDSWSKTREFQNGSRA